MGLHIKRTRQRLKLHVAVNQLGLPLKAIITPANRFDSIFLPQLIDNIKAQYVLANAGYHSLENLRVVKASGALPIIAVNPHRQGKESKVSNDVFFGGKRWPVEQLNGHFKANVLRGCWVRPRELLKKASMVVAGLISVNVNAIAALIEGDCGLKVVSKYWD